MLLVLDIKQIILNISWGSFTILLFFIGYRFLMKRMKRSQLQKDLYFTLHPIEKEPATGTVQLFLETPNSMEIELSIYSTDQTVDQLIEHKTYKKGGNIIQLDTTVFKNGIYFYQAKSAHQKARKKIEIKN